MGKKLAGAHGGAPEPMAKGPWASARRGHRASDGAQTVAKVTGGRKSPWEAASTQKGSPWSCGVLQSMADDRRRAVGEIHREYIDFDVMASCDSGRGVEKLF